MSEKYIRENKNSYKIVKNSKTYAKISSLEDAIFIRDLLIRTDWNLSKIPKTIKNDGDYLILSVLDEKIYVIARYDYEPSSDTVDRLIKRHRRNPNNSKYGLNITRVFDTFIIKKQIFNDDYIFGYFDNLSDAEFVRNFLMDNDWNVNALNKIEFDDETNTYKAVSVIDDVAYVLGTFNTPEIDLDKVHVEFLSKISKHKYGLADYPHLDLLKDRIPELELKYNVKTTDGVWSFGEDISSPLKDIIFNLTPFQQSVYDSISNKTTLDEIKKKLIRYKSKNFEKKIDKNLNDLIEMGLVEKEEDNSYTKL